ncbi:Hypothetical predicted protein [Olea europaea subsp. europaea]|uniref:Uncharacterized protein n=1 Tax=Olea europaea subsp. europaea TaxID=158383 RepID=A0A8S0Q9P4_OLEEU|nr:Hypothetical predicted protein [Olea europaea subsp. europaea]
MLNMYSFWRRSVGTMSTAVDFASGGRFFFECLGQQKEEVAVEKSSYTQKPASKTGNNEMSLNKTSKIHLTTMNPVTRIVAEYPLACRTETRLNLEYPTVDTDQNTLEFQLLIPTAETMTDCEAEATDPQAKLKQHGEQPSTKEAI